jgi:hypothetical protein
MDFDPQKIIEGYGSIGSSNIPDTCGHILVVDVISK